MSWLFHISEEPGISLFEPRLVGGWDRRVDGLAVWAIDEEHLPNYLLPRDCPRVTYVCDASTTQADREHFFGASTARRIIAIEPAWIERAVSTPIYLYDMPADSFSCIDTHAGHYISRVTVVPSNVQRIDSPLTEMLKHNVEVRIVKELFALHAAVAGSSLSFSSTRLANAGR